MGAFNSDRNAKTQKGHAKPAKTPGAAAKGRYIGQTKKVTTPSGGGNRERC